MKNDKTIISFVEVNTSFYGPSKRYSPKPLGQYEFLWTLKTIFTSA
jgi:hypothetical protein